MQCNDAVFTFTMCVFFLANKKRDQTKKVDGEEEKHVRAVTVPVRDR
jgi:hypothetical protein